MATAAKVAGLLDSLPNSDDKITALSELKTLLSSVQTQALRDVSPNVSFNVIFELLNTTNSEQIQLCCEVLDKLLEAMDPVALMSHYETELLQGLGHPDQGVKQLTLKQVLHATNASGHQMSPQSDILIQIVAMLADDSLTVATKAMNILVKLAEDPDQLNAIFNEGVVCHMKNAMEKSDIIRFRVYELLVRLGCLSPEALDVVDRSGMLQQLVNEVHKDDLLVQLNCLELLKDLAMCYHGYSYLDNKGVVAKMEGILATIDSDPMAGFLLPGLVKFFGSVAYIYPRELSGRFQNFMAVVFQMLDNPDSSLKCIAVETLGLIGSTSDGKLALEKQGGRMDQACKCIGSTVKDATTEIRVRGLQAFSSLINLPVPDQTAELLALTESWFRNLASSPMDLLTDLAKQPFTNLRCAVFNTFTSMALTPWGQQAMKNHAGFNEYLLDRSTEKTKEGKEGKYGIIATLVESPTAMEIFGRPYFVMLKEYHNEGPFFVRTESAVAFEGE